MRTRSRAYAVSIAGLTAAVLVRWLLDPLMGDALPLVTLFGAVAAAVWLGGYRPAVVVTLLGYAACEYLFIAPRGSLKLDTPGDVIGLVAYLFTSALIIAIGEAMHAAQARVNQQREVLQITLRSIGDAVITTDLNGRVTYLNGVAEALTGWTHADAIGLPLDAVFRIVNEATRQPTENPALKALREGVVVGLANHTVLIMKDGGERSIDDSAAPITNDRGQVSGCVLIFRDVSAQRRQDQNRIAQLQTARLLASIVESSEDAIISKSLEGVIQTWNAAAERLFGYSAEEAIGRHITLIIPPERISEEDIIVARLKAGQRIEHFETERLRADGWRIFVSLTISPIVDETGAIVGASKIVRDITRQREAASRERQLLSDATAANAKFRAFFEQGALFAGIMSVDGTLLEANRLSLEGCGYTKEQAIGKRFWEGPWWTPSADLVERIRVASGQAAAGEAFHAEMPYFIAGGVERLAEVTILPIRDEAGRVLFLAPTGADVTERRRLEDHLRKLTADLSDADRRKNEFLATLAHELRNPLAPLWNMLEVLKHADSDARALERARDTIERQLKQMVRLVDDLLDLNRITHNRLELRQSEVELSEVIHQAIESASPLADAAAHQLQVTLPPEPIYLHADPARLAQVFGNLLNNSCKYTQPGGTIRVMARRDGSQVAVSVSDDGAGIPPDKLASIFEMFTQLDRSLERSQGGLGLGLTLVKQLVEMHGGSIEARSAGEGHGSEFIVRLPVLAERSAAVEPPAVTRAPAPRRILVVDDNKDAAVSSAMLLELSGNEVYTAHDGLEAIEAAAKHRPHVILLDIGLPRMNGHEVCRRIREQPWGKGMVLIALTGWGQDEDRQKSKDAGFDGHIVKPADPDALLELLSQLAPDASA